MLYFRTSVLCTLMILMLLVFGCSSGIVNTPTAPDDELSGISANIPIFTMTDTGDVFNAMELFGVYELTIDPEKQTADLISKRTSAIGEDYLVSGKAFFTIAPCPNCLKLTGISLLLDGSMELSFNVAHPFQPADMGKPPSASNRNDLDVFDLAAVILPTGATETIYSLTGKGVYDQCCVAADGYTTELSDMLPAESAALPYFLAVDDSDTGVSTFNKFMMGSNSDFSIGFDLSGGPLVFDLYLTMAYGFSAKKPDRLNPKYYNPEFNRKSAWKVSAIPPEGIDPPAIGNTWQDNDPTTEFDVQVVVYDWQIGATVSTESDFSDADPTHVFAASEPSIVSVEVPGMTTSVFEVLLPDDPLATGMPDDPWVYSVPVANENLLPAGEYTSLVRVVDQRPVLSPSEFRDFLIDSPDGVILDHYTIPEYATYQIFTATVVVGNAEPNCTFTLGDTSVDVGNTTLCTPGVMSDPDGSIVSYEWDLDYDGVTFNADITQLSTDLGFGNPFDIGPLCLTTYVDNLLTIGLRVADDNSPPAQVVCSQDINVIASWVYEPGDLIADTVNRGEGSADAELVTSVTLDWTAVPCAQEYVIENANSMMNPTSWSAVDTVTTNTFDYPIGTAQQETAHRVRVYARMYTGDDSVVTPYSEHVGMVFASDYQHTSRQFERTREAVGAAGNPSLASGGFQDPSGDYNVDNWPSDHLYTYASFTNPVNEANFTNRWAMHYREFPEFAGQTVAYIDCYVMSISTRAWTVDTGWCFGTIGTTIPAIDTGIPTVFDFLPTNSARGSLYTYETSNIGGFQTEYGDSGQSGFQIVDSNDSWQHTSYFLNDLLNTDRDFAVIAYAIGNTAPNGGTDYQCVGLTDAIAVIVY